MKALFAATLIAISSVAANAGTITYVAPSNVNIEMEPDMSLRPAGWVVPLVIVAVLALALTQGNGEEYCEECEQ